MKKALIIYFWYSSCSELNIEVIFNFNSISCDLFSYLKTIVNIKLSATDISYYNITNYPYNIMDISKLAQINKDIASYYGINRGSYSIVYTPYQKFIYSMLKPIYFVPFTGVILIILHNITNNLVIIKNSFCNYLFKQIKYLKYFSLNQFKIVKEEIKDFFQPISKRAGWTNPSAGYTDTLDNDIPSHLRNITVFAVNNININTNTVNTRLAELNRNYDIIYNDMVSLAAILRDLLGIWGRRVTDLNTNQGIIVGTDRNSNTDLQFPPEMPSALRDRHTHAINLRTVQFIGYFPTLADLLAQLHYTARQINLLDPSFVLEDIVILTEIFSLIDLSHHMYTQRDFDERFNETLNNLLNPNSKNKRKDIDSDEDLSNKLSSKKRKDEDDDSNNNPQII